MFAGGKSPCGGWAAIPACWLVAGNLGMVRRASHPPTKEQSPHHPSMTSPIASRAASRANGAHLRLAADIGGTFTDIAVFDDRSGKLSFGHARSTPPRRVGGLNSRHGKPREHAILHRA